jgi:hypothetical protein
LLDVLFVGERDADRWEVGFGVPEPLRQSGDRLLAILGQFELLARRVQLGVFARSG